MGRGHQRRFERLGRRILDGPGRLDARWRQAAARKDAGALPAELAGYVALVHDHAYRIVDSDLEALRAAGYSEDEVFELTVAAAVGAGLGRLERARRAMEGG
jgi:alkylhydroperoxidase family enzyme